MIRRFAAVSVAALALVAALGIPAVAQDPTLGPPQATPIADPPSVPSGDGTGVRLQTSEGDIVIGLDQMFWDFRRGEQVVGLDWDIWMQLMAVAKSEASEPLVRDIAAWLSSSRWSGAGKQAEPGAAPDPAGM